MSSSNSRRSQSVNSNGIYGTSNYNPKNQQNNSGFSNQNQMQNQKAKSRSQHKRLQVLRLNIDDLNTLLSCYQSREDSVFQMRVTVVQMLENINCKTQQENSNSLRHICNILQETERIRVIEESKVIEKYSSPNIQPIVLENNTSVKQMVFRFGSKLNKMNNSYFQKIQFYFPRMADLIQQDQCAWNSQFKESLSQIMSNNLSTLKELNLQQSNSNSTQGNNNGQNGVYLTFALNHIITKSRQKFQKEHTKLACYQQAYSGLIEKTVGIPRAVDKCNKNEKFFLDKYIQGAGAFAYTQYLMKKYLIKSSTKFIRLGYSQQMRQAVKQTWKNPYDILLLEDNKANTNQAAVSNSSQPGNGTTPSSSSCVSTSKTTSASESVWEIIITNYDKNIKEMLSYNKSINTQIKSYIESHSKKGQQLKQSQLLQSNLFQNKSQITLSKPNSSQQCLPSQKSHQNTASSNILPEKNDFEKQVKQTKQIEKILSQENGQGEQVKQATIEQTNQEINIENKSQLNVKENKQDSIDNKFNNLISKEMPKEDLIGRMKGESNLLKQKVSPLSAEALNNQSLNLALASSLSSRNVGSQSYQNYQDDDLVRMTSNKMNGQLNIGGNNEKKNKSNYFIDEYLSDSIDQTINNEITMTISEQLPNTINQKIQYGIIDSNFYVSNNDELKTREKSHTFNHAAQIDNPTSSIKDSELLKYYTHSKNKSYQDSMGEYQFVRRMKSNDSKNLTQRTNELEENSFQSSGNPYRILRASNPTSNQIIQGSDDTQVGSQAKQSGLVLNSGVNTSNVQNKQLQRVIINPFQSDIIPNSCTNSLQNKKGSMLYIKSNGNSMQNIILKTSSSNINLNTSNPINNVNGGNIFNQQPQLQINNINGQYSSNNNYNNNNNNSNSSNQGKNTFMRFSVTSIQKQTDLPYIEQFNQIFESKKKNLYQMCNSNQQIPNQQTNQKSGQHPHQSHSLPQSIQNNTFTQGSNVTQPNEEQDEVVLPPPLLDANALSKRQKQIKIFTITSREGNNLVQNGLQPQHQQQVQLQLSEQQYMNSINSIGTITGLTTPSSNLQLASLSKVPIDIPLNSKSIQSSQNSVNLQLTNSNQKSELPSNTNSQVNLNSCNSTIPNQNSNNSQYNNKSNSKNPTNNTNTPLLKTNIQLKMSHKMYSGPTFTSLITNKNSQATPLKNNPNIQPPKNKRQTTMSSDPACNDHINNRLTNAQEISQTNLHIQKFCNLNLEQNVYSSVNFDSGQDGNFQDPQYKQSQTPSISKNLPPDSLHLIKQNYKSNKPLYESINQTGQLVNLNLSNSQQPVYSRISNAVQGSFSPLKLDQLDQRRQLSTKNNQNLQYNIVKRSDNFRRKSINSAQNNNQQSQQQQQGGNIFQKATPPPSNINRQKKSNIISLQHQNQFVIKKNQIKNYDSTTTSLSTNKSPA